ncbi:MAG: MMPL family transporter [Methanomassiliicoccales archaeon]|nr:MAG: MMPL family transporter [Methanomassiliicoccales archaeon]
MAKTIVRHHKKIILLWVMLLIIAIPFAPLARDAVVYDDRAGAEDLELGSVKAQKWIDDNFASSSGSGSIILVMVSPDAFSAETRQIVYELTAKIIRGSPVFGGELKDNATVQSVYSMVSQYAAGYLIGTNDAYYEVFDEMNSTRYLIFGIPMNFREIYNQTVDVQALLFGLPSMYKDIWDQVNFTIPGSAMEDIDNVTYFQARMSAEAYLTSKGADEVERALTMSYLEHFSSSWNSTAHIPAVNSSSTSRLEASLMSGFVSFTNGTTFLSIPEDDRLFISAVFTSFSLDDHEDIQTRNSFCDEIFSGYLTKMLEDMPGQRASLAMTYYSIFYQAWTSDLDGVNETEYRNIISSSVSSVSAHISIEDAMVFQTLFEQLGWTGWESDERLCQIVSEVVSEVTGVERWLVKEVADAGRRPSMFKLSLLADKIVQNRSLANFPIPLVPAMVQGFINVPKNDTMLILLSFRGPGGELTSGSDDVKEIRSMIDEVLEGRPEVKIYVTGTGAIGQDIEESVKKDIERIDPFTIALVLILIGLYFRSFVASAVPPVIIGLGVGVAYATVYFLGTYFLDINYYLLTLLLTSMLGAGCDYCIFILSRYREERRKGSTKEQAVVTSVTWAGEAITISGLTVIIGFGALSLGSLDVMRSMGLLAVGIVCALLLALTLLPSILMLLGDRMFWPSIIISQRGPKMKGYFTRSAKFAIKHAKAILAVSILVSVPASYLSISLETSYDFIGTMPDTESKTGLAQMSDGFGGGKITPTEVGVELSTSIFNSTGGWDLDNMDRIEALCAALSELDNVNIVTSPTRPYGAPIDYSSISGNSSIEAMLYDQIMRTMVGANATAVLVTVILEEEPFSPVSIESIKDIREVVDGLVRSDTGFDAIYVGGGTAMMYDVAHTTQEDFRTIVLVVIVLIYVVLLVMLGSVINPIRSILTILVSISWTLAGAMIIFEQIFGQTINWLVPLILLVVCLGLGMDYDILLSTRVREETYRGLPNNDAIIHSVEQTGGIITACGIIMAGAFGTMMLSQGWLLREFGFVLMFAILLDATVVRIYMVPAIMSLLGRWNWWMPKRLKRT